MTITPFGFDLWKGKKELLMVVMGWVRQSNFSYWRTKPEWGTKITVGENSFLSVWVASQCTLSQLPLWPAFLLSLLQSRHFLTPLNSLSQAVSHPVIYPFLSMVKVGAEVEVETMRSSKRRDGASGPFCPFNRCGKTHSHRKDCHEGRSLPTVP